MNAPAQMNVPTQINFVNEEEKEERPLPQQGQGQGSGSGSKQQKQPAQGLLQLGEEQILPEKKPSSLFYSLLESMSFSNPNRMLENKDVIVFLVNLFNITINTEKINGKVTEKNILKFLYCIPPFWKNDISRVAYQKLAVGSLGSILEYINKCVTENRVEMDVAPEIHVLNLFGFHYLLLKLYNYLDNYHKIYENDSEALIKREVCRDLLNTVFRSSSAVQTDIILVLEKQINKNFVLELFLPRKMFQIYKNWKSGAYTVVEAIQYYEFSFEKIITPIFKIPNEPTS